MKTFEVIYNTPSIKNCRYAFGAENLEEAKAKAPKLINGEILTVVEVDDLGTPVASETKAHLNPLDRSIGFIELNSEKFQIWVGSCIIQLHKGQYFRIQNSHSFRWATNFVSFDEAKKHADILIGNENRTGGIKIRQGNRTFAAFRDNEWVIHPEPIAELL